MIEPGRAAVPHGSVRLEQQVRSLTERLVQAQGELRRAEERIAALTTVDEETGALNARAFHERAVTEIQRASRYHRDLALVLVQPDDDASRRRLAELARTQLRTSDFVGRTDAGELALLLPETALPGALVLAERICALAGRGGFPARAGCAGWPADGRFVGQLIGAARSALSMAASRARSASSP